MPALVSSPPVTVVPTQSAAPHPSPLPIKTAPLAFADAPVLFAACCFALGMIGARLLWISPAVLLTAILLAAASTIVAGRAASRVALLPLGCLWALLGSLCLEIRPPVEPQQALIHWADGSPHAMVGTIFRVGPSRILESAMPYTDELRKEQSQSVDLRVSTVDGVPVSGGLRFTLYAPLDERLPSFECGGSVRLTSAMHLPDRFHDPGVWDGRAYLLDQGIALVGSAKAGSVSVDNATPRRPDIGCRLGRLQQNSSQRLLALADPPRSRLPAQLTLGHDDAAMLSAMITGDRTWLEQRVRVGFERTGSFHLLVVSGLHLAIFAGLVAWIAARLRAGRLLATAVTIALSFAYAVFTGFGQPVQRSFWMVTLYLIARLLWRQKNSLNAIGFAALCLLAYHPDALFEAGFQMTLLSVIAIGGIAAPVAERTFAPYMHGLQSLSLIALDPALPPLVAQFRVSVRLLFTHLQPLIGRRIAWQFLPWLLRMLLRGLELVLVSVTIELVMSLPMAIYFHRITVLALPVNILIVPFLTVLLPAALLSFLTLLVLPSIAAAPVAVTSVMLHVVTGIIGAFSNLRSGDLRLPGPPPAAIVGYILLLALAIWLVRRPRFALPLGCASLATAAFLVMVPLPFRNQRGALEVTAIDVGQGDSLLVVSPDGLTLLVDGGGTPFGPPPGVSRFDIGEDVVSQVLWSRGIRRLDAVALTHAHADHIGGLPAVLANFHPRELWVGKNPDSPAYDQLLTEAAQLDISVRHFVERDAFAFGSAHIEILEPPADCHPGKAPANNDSLAMRVSYGATSALLEGDAEGPSERRMVRDEPLHADLLKIGHHGSRSSTTPDFFHSVAPSYAVISVGRRNMYGHPRREVLAELQDAHVRTYRTDLVGITTFYLDGKQVSPGTFPPQ